MTELNVAGVGGVPPTGATAVVLNVTADAPITSGYVTAWPSGEDQPPVSNLNYFPGQTVPNLVTVKIGANGRVNLFNSTGFTQVVADVVGYYTAATAGCTGRFTAVTPGRVLDTRNGTGHSGAVGPGQAINVTVTGLQGVPTSGVSGVALNVTADSPTAPGYLTVWPTGEAQPGASSHNFVPGLTVANLVLAKVGTGGQVSIFNSAGFTHVVADVVGYFSASGGVFVPLSPQRIVDSRYGIGRGVGGLLGGGQTINVDVAGVGGVPSNATAAIVNVTSTDSATPSFITVWPAGDPMPTASTLNPRPGVPVPNLAYLKLRGGQLVDLQQRRHRPTTSSTSSATSSDATANDASQAIATALTASNSHGCSVAAAMKRCATAAIRRAPPCSAAAPARAWRPRRRLPRRQAFASTARPGLWPRRGVQHATCCKCNRVAALPDRADASMNDHLEDRRQRQRCCKPGQVPPPPRHVNEHPVRSERQRRDPDQLGRVPGA